MKRIIALVLAMTMVFALLPFSAFGVVTLATSGVSTFEGATVDEINPETSEPEVNNSWIHQNYTVGSANVNVIQFSPANGYFPMAYAYEAGKTNYLQDHVNAAIAEGYTVVGAINASFFDLATGDPCSRLISDGKIVYDHTEMNDVLTVFFDDGTNQLLNSVDTDYSLTLGNNTISTDAIGMVNKDYTAVNLVSASIGPRYHYYDSDMGALNGSENTGYEILCKKLNGTEIAFGKTLQGEVISVTYGYYGKTTVTADDEFVLFVKDTGTYVDYATALSAGDSVALTATCTDSVSAEVLSKANSAIGSTYWLVHDGVDLTDTQSTIIHSTSLARAWTAFGWDDNGNYYFYVSEEYGLTLKQVADDMQKLGCTNVLRLDGGGSTTMWVQGKGIVENAGGRAVVDCILIVEREPVVPDTSEPETSEPETSEPETSEPETSEPETSEPEVSEPETSEPETSEPEVSEPETSEPETSEPEVSEPETSDPTEEITVENNIALGKPYSTSKPWRMNDNWEYDENAEIYYPDEGDITLTDGIIAGDGNYTNSAWVGLHSNTPDITDGYAWVTVDLGGDCQITETILYLPVEKGADYNSAGIYMPSSIVISVSNDGETWKDVGALDQNEITAQSASFSQYVSAVSIKTETTGRYLRAKYGNGGWAFICEIAVVGKEHTVHTPETDKWFFDETNHWSECICGEKLNITSHTAGEWETVTEADVDKEGKKELRCSVCNYLMDTETIPALHAPLTDKWYNNADEHWQQCGCGKELDNATHTAGEWETVTEADVDKEGKKELRCSVCDYLMDTETIPATHEPEADVWFTDANNHWQECGCGKKLNAEKHSSEYWIIVKEAGEKTDGKKELRCDICDYLMDSEVIPATNPDSGNTNNQPQININGNIIINGDININNQYNNININSGNAFDGDTTINVNEIKNGDTYNMVSDALESISSSFMAYDFSATKNGEEVQPAETFTIDFAIPEEFSNDVSVLYVAPDGSTEEMPSTVNEEERIVTAEISHFSIYVLVDNAATDDEVDVSDGQLGDINANGKIDMTDYILLKRAYFGTYKFTEDQNKVGDINKNNKIDMTDYILLKRVYFGTYTIK